MGSSSKVESNMADKGGPPLKQELNDIETILEPMLKQEGVSLSHIEYVTEGKDNFLRIYIDKSGGVDLDDCTRVSEKASELLDKRDPLKAAYFLEVSSPGVERPLKTKNDFEQHIGANMYVSLYVHIGGEKEFTGTLKEFNNDELTIEYKWKHTVKQVHIPFDKIAKAHLAVML